MRSPPAPVFLNEREARAGDGFLCRLARTRAKLGKQGADKRGLAAAERALEVEDEAGADKRGDEAGEGPGLRLGLKEEARQRRGGGEGGGGHPSSLVLRCIAAALARGGGGVYTSRRPKPRHPTPLAPPRPVISAAGSSRAACRHASGARRVRPASRTRRARCPRRVRRPRRARALAPLALASAALLLHAASLPARADGTGGVDGSAPAEPVIEQLSAAESAALDAGDAGLGALSSSDRALYARIFVLQEEARWEESAALIAQLDDKILLGHATEQRLMHPTGYRSPYHELAAWLEAYGDHPGAERVWRLAKRRRPAGAEGPRAPARLERTLFAPPAKEAAGEGEGAAAEEEEDAAAAPANEPVLHSPRVIRGHSHAARQLMREVHRNVLRERLTATEKRLREPRVRAVLQEREFGEALSRLAAGWLRWGEPERALALAEEGTALSGAWYPIGHWTAGLTAWQLGDFARAEAHFAALQAAEHAAPAYRARGGWWASRAALRDGRLGDYASYLRRAALEEESFYAALAREALGLGAHSATEGGAGGSADASSPSGSRLPPGALQALKGQPKAWRAVALLEAGQLTRAEAELARLGPLHDAALADAVLQLADRAGLAQTAVRAADEILRARRAGRDAAGAGTEAVLAAALYPLPAFAPDGGFIVDRALLFAMMREESRFNAEAVSRDGARGLMQLLPSTAAYITGDRSLARQEGRRRLFDPGRNLAAAQLYILYLLADESVANDPLRLIAAYNAGPGNLKRWSARLAARGVRAEEDALLYLEMLPSRETRGYCLEVLSSLWRYRERLGQDRPVLRALVARQTPVYEPQDRFLTARAP